MSKALKIGIALAGALTAGACATGRTYSDDPELREVTVNCGLTGARLLRDRADRRTIRLSQPIDAAIPEPGQISCLTHWASERGLTFVLPSDWPR